MAKVEVKLEGGHAQVEDRYTGWLNDQHGRTWTGSFSKRGGTPTDAMNPTRWTAPQSPQWLRGLFVPPEQYRQVVRAEAAPLALHIDYDGWIATLNAAQAHFDQTKIDVINHQAQGFDAIRLMEHPPASLLRILGPSPFPPLEVVERMAEGDAWALGKSDEVPAWFTKTLEQEIVHTGRATGLFQTWQLRELNKVERAGRKAADQEAIAVAEAAADPMELSAHTTWPQFWKIACAAGKTIKEAAEDWKIHKEALAGV